MITRRYSAQMGMRETEDRVSSQPSPVAQAGDTSPLVSLSGLQRTRAPMKVAWRQGGGGARR